MNEILLLNKTENNVMKKVQFVIFFIDRPTATNSGPNWSKSGGHDFIEKLGLRAFQQYMMGGGALTLEKYG